MRIIGQMFTCLKPLTALIYAIVLNMQFSGIELMLFCSIPFLENDMIAGSIVALVTPMFEDGRLDWESLDSLLDFHITNRRNNKSQSHQAE